MAFYKWMTKFNIIPSLGSISEMAMGRRKLRLHLLVVAASFILRGEGGVDLAAKEYWGAVAVGEWRDEDGDANITIGYSNDNDSREEAAANAIADCNDDNDRKDCRVIEYSSSGQCLYITYGSYPASSDPKGLGGVCYGWGATPDRAIAVCKANQGVVIDKPIGGCNAAAD